MQIALSAQNCIPKAQTKLAVSTVSIIEKILPAHLIFDFQIMGSIILAEVDFLVLK
jgi:hypothetical protein